MSAYDLFNEALARATNPTNLPAVVSHAPRRLSSQAPAPTVSRTAVENHRGSTVSVANSASFPPPNRPYEGFGEVWQGHESAQAAAIYRSGQYGAYAPIPGLVPYDNYCDQYPTEQDSRAHAQALRQNLEPWNVPADMSHNIRRDHTLAREDSQGRASAVDNLFSDVDETEAVTRKDDYEPYKTHGCVVLTSAEDSERTKDWPINVMTQEVERNVKLRDEWSTQAVLGTSISTEAASGIFSTSRQPALETQHEDAVPSQPHLTILCPSEEDASHEYCMTGARPISPTQITSPTESQLMVEGFEFHNGLPDDVQIDKFGDKAFRKALREINPELPRKQQWYAWDKVRKLLEASPRKGDQLQSLINCGVEDGHPYVKAEEQLIRNDGLFDIGEHTLKEDKMSSDCEGVITKCKCNGGGFTCSNCGKHGYGDVEATLEKASPGRLPRSASSNSFPEPSFSDTSTSSADCLEASEFQLPSNWPRNNCTGTPATAMDGHMTFGSENRGPFNLPGPAAFSNCTGYPAKEEEDKIVADRQVPQIKQGIEVTPKADSRPSCSCICGSSCECPEGHCICDSRHDERSTFQPTSDEASLQQDQVWSTTSSSWASVPTNVHDTSHEDPLKGPPFNNEFPKHQPMIRRTVEAAASSPFCPPPRTQSLDPVPRPDTPRPFDPKLRQSVEPETPSHLIQRESTPAYEARSPSPSPTSHASLDVDMSDAPPIPLMPRLPLPTSSPDPISSPMHPVTAPETPLPPSSAPRPRDRSRSRSPSKIAASPQTPTPLKPSKRGDKSRRKSTVQGSKVEKTGGKSRNVTQKLTNSVRKATEKVKKEGTKVADAVAKIEETVRKQSDGTPTRRSERIKKKRASLGSY